MKKLIRINIGDPQPVDCPRCKDKFGYQYTDNIKTQYTCHHEPDGSHYGGEFSDYQPITKAATEIYCLNCGTKLAAKLIRE